MEITIKQPLELQLEVIETDDYLLSMRVQLHATVFQFQHLCRYEGALWIEFACWDEFTTSLRSSSWQEAVLRDMSGYFLLAIRRTGNGLLFTWEYAKSDIDGDRRLNIVFSSKIDDDMFGKIRNEFLDFPVWW